MFSNATYKMVRVSPAPAEEEAEEEAETMCQQFNVFGFGDIGSGVINFPWHWRELKSLKCLQNAMSRLKCIHVPCPDFSVLVFMI